MSVTQNNNATKNNNSSEIGNGMAVKGESKSVSQAHNNLSLVGSGPIAANNCSTTKEAMMQARREQQSIQSKRSLANQNS